jgi:hypothetical protein
VAPPPSDGSRCCEGAIRWPVRGVGHTVPCGTCRAGYIVFQEERANFHVLHKSLTLANFTISKHFLQF